MTDLEEMSEYLAHQSWRCDYRSRYERCRCGLDDLCDRLGIDRVPPDDPERSWHADGAPILAEEKQTGFPGSKPEVAVPKAF